jgi:hypothetical protein
MLRRVWIAFGKEWIKTAEENDRRIAEAKANGLKYEDNKFYIKSAQNQGYKTWNVIVPMKTFREKIAAASIIDVSRELNDWSPPA